MLWKRDCTNVTMQFQFSSVPPKTYQTQKYFIKELLVSLLPVPVAARSKAWVSGRSLARSVVSNPTWRHGWLLWVLSGRGLCDGLITRPEDFYRLYCVLCVI
jgi:hypothetical protein